MSRRSALLKRLERYFLEEVAIRVARGMPLPVLLADLESQLPEWITAIPVVWGTPRYAILRVYRGLVDDPAGEPGWQHYKPSAIPAGDPARVQAACAALTDLRAFQEVARECEEGGDLGSAIAVARSATHWAPTEPAAWVLLAECLMRGAASVASVLEKGDFFSEARQALQRALELEPQYTASASGARTLSRDDRLSQWWYTDPRDAAFAASDREPARPRHGPQAALLAQAYFYMGMGYRTMGDESQAMACFDYRLDPPADVPASTPGGSQGYDAVASLRTLEGYSDESRCFRTVHQP